MLAKGMWDLTWRLKGQGTSPELVDLDWNITEYKFSCFHAGECSKCDLIMRHHIVL